MYPGKLKQPLDIKWMCGHIKWMCQFLIMSPSLKGCYHTSHNTVVTSCTKFTKNHKIDEWATDLVTGAEAALLW